MEPQKSSKKISVIVVVLVLLIGILIGGYLVLHSNFSTATIAEQISKILEQGKEPIANCRPNPDDKNKDSDNDGLMDWQEATWKTDPCVPDTDKDGYLDGEEVSSGYSPIIQAPNDILSNQDTSSPRGLPSNLTQALTQILKEKITNGQMGSIVDASSLSAINTSNQAINSAIQEIIANSSQEFSLPYISDDEIIISSDNSKENVINYSKKVSETITQLTTSKAVNKTNLFKSEEELIYYAVKKNDFSMINKQASFYKSIAKKIKLIPVPSNLKDIHKEQIGIFQTMFNIYQAISNIQTDPLKANLAIEQHRTITGLSFEVSKKIIDIIGNQ